MATILLTGGTGLVGKNLTNKLLKNGHTVHVLTRSEKEGKANLKFFQWDIKKEQLDKSALDDVDVVVHIAGAGVADKPWTARYREEIISSRVDSIRLLYKAFENKGIWPKKVISASGTAYYGFENSNKIFVEEDKIGSGFLSSVTALWEAASDGFEKKGVERTIFRIGVVLSKNGGALGPMKIPFKLGVGSPMGSGKQPMPWIHIDDLTNGIIASVEENVPAGIYNAVAPEMVDNQQFSKTLAKKMGVIYWAPNVPGFVLRIILGRQKADEMLLNGAHVSSQKLVNAGFSFLYSSLGGALEEVLN